MLEKPILIVHPNDKTTSSLNKIKTHLLQRFEGKIHHFNIYSNDNSHSKCLERIKTHSENGLIIFFGHGRTTKLYGSKGDFYDNIDFVSDDIINEHPEKYYYNDSFIDEENISVFSNKKVFCLACNSNDKIAEYALEKRAKVFLGFGGIPSSKAEFIEDGLKNVSKRLVIFMKTEVNYIIKKSLEIGIANDYNFNQLRDIIHFIINQRVSHYLRVNKTSKIRHTLVDYLYTLKKEIRILGDGKCKLVE